MLNRLRPGAASIGKGFEKMSQPQWTDEFLDQKRQIGDKWYDQYIKDVLGESFLDDYQEIFSGWVKLQSDQISEGKRILSSLTGDADPSPDTKQAIDTLAGLQVEQYTRTTKWAMHLWPQRIHFHIQSARVTTVIACRALAHHELRHGLSAMECALTNGTLLVEEYDKLSDKIASSPDLKQQMSQENRLAYNRFLGVVETIHDNPGIFLWDQAFSKMQFESYPWGLNDNFTPVWCPPWVDGEKLKLGVEIWERHMSECLFLLFACSLPACYLDRRGIPMLYKTERLAKQEFIAERIYETGFFLNDVMKKDGLTVIQEPVAKRIAYLAVAAHKAHPDWRFHFGRYFVPEWHDSTGGVHSYKDALSDPEIKQEFDVLEKQDKSTWSYSAAELGAPSFNRLFRDSLEGVRDPSQDYLWDNCIWGPGFLVATKVRYFHAEMRYRALRTHPPYDVAEHGFPINQEDLAYTLLTFGYVIPAGLEKLGAVLTRAEKEGFLHCWRVVGHLMGIDDDLLTDDWDQAKALYEKIKGRLQGKSAGGEKLTGAVCTFITDLLPTWFPFRSAIPAVWIRDQLGADADDLFDPATQAASRNLPVRVCWALVKHVLFRCYFLSRSLFWDKFQYPRRVTDLILQFLGEALLTSWHQTFKRQRFSLTAHLEGFTPDAGVSAAEKQKRLDIRRKVFLLFLMGFCLMVIFHPIFWVGVASFVAWYISSADWLGTLAKAMLCLLILQQIGLNYIVRKLQRFLKELAFHTGSKF